MKVIIKRNNPGFTIEIDGINTYTSNYFSYLTTFLKITERGKDIKISLTNDDVVYYMGRNMKTRTHYYIKKPLVLNKK